VLTRAREKVVVIVCSKAVEFGILKHPVTESVNFCPFISKIIHDIFRFFVANTNEGLAVEDTLYYQETFF